MLVDRGTRFTARGKPIYRESVLPLVLLVFVSELPFIVWGGAWSSKICDCCETAACLASGSSAEFPKDNTTSHFLDESINSHFLNELSGMDSSADASALRYCHGLLQFSTLACRFW
jgi:hypothetical protein